MIVLIQDQIIVPVEQAGDHAQVYLETSTEQDRSFLAYISGQSSFQFNMNVKCTI
ncbi:hypothetical protein D3C87_1488940 [compost metagenome]